MAFWSTNFGENSTLPDPKRNFRFVVSFDGISAGSTGDSAALWYAKTVTKPAFQIAASEHKYLNHTFYYPGSVTWTDVTITLVDPVDPDMTATLSDIIVASGYSPPATAEDRTTMSKAKSAAALGTVTIQQIDAEGNALETWTLWNSFITEVKYGDLEYGNDDLTELSVTLKYDWARVATTHDSAGPTEGNTFFGVTSA